MTRTARQEEFGRDQLQSLGRRLRELREARRWSLRHMASQAGVSVAAIQSLEGGNGNPSLLTVVALAESLGEPVDRLIASARSDSIVTHTGLGQLPDTTGELHGPAGRPRMAAKLIVLPARRAIDDIDGDHPAFFYLLDGKVRFEFHAGGSEDLGPGDALHAAAGVIKRFANVAGRRSRILFFTDRREPVDRQPEFA